LAGCGKQHGGPKVAVRTLVTLTARRGQSPNKIACALVSMMARSTCSNRRLVFFAFKRISLNRVVY
jgi:hypothetical protein